MYVPQKSPFEIPANMRAYLEREFAALARELNQGDEHVEVWVEDFKAAGDGVADDTGAILEAVAALRRFPADRLDTIGGDTITMYRSGVLNFGPGVFKVSPDALEFVADMGLTWRGAGSRRFTNAIQGRTTILVSGTSAGFGIKIHRNGARSMHFEDIDVCYEDENFTGDLIDMLDAPGLKFRRCYLGTYGITGATRKQTAQSLLRLTYLEDVSLTDCTLDGAVDGIWSDDTRTELGNTFGGWGLYLKRVTFYDFTGTMLRHDGNRTLANVFVHAYFNPINFDCVRSVDLENVDGLELRNALFAPSTASKASTEWLRLSNVTGKVATCTFGDLAKAGSISGSLEVTGNVLAGTDGITLRGGIIRLGPNEISTGAKGFEVADPPDDQLTVLMDAQRAKAAVGELVDLGPDTASVRGLVTHDPAQDQSTTPFSNANTHITVTSLT